MALNNTNKQYYSDIIEMNKKLSESLQKPLNMYDKLSKKNDALVSKVETLNNKKINTNNFEDECLKLQKILAQK